MSADPQQNDADWNLFSKGDIPKLVQQKWCVVTPSSLDFIQKLMHLDPAKRMSIADALHHEWLADPIAPVPAPRDLLTQNSKETKEETRPLENDGYSEHPNGQVLDPVPAQQVPSWPPAVTPNATKNGNRQGIAQRTRSPLRSVSPRTAPAQAQTLDQRAPPLPPGTRSVRQLHQMPTPSLSIRTQSPAPLPGAAPASNLPPRLLRGLSPSSSMQRVANMAPQLRSPVPQRDGQATDDSIDRSRDWVFRSNLDIRAGE